jgi:hypothetical protein
LVWATATAVVIVVSASVALRALNPDELAFLDQLGGKRTWYSAGDGLESYEEWFPASSTGSLVAEARKRMVENPTQSGTAWEFHVRGARFPVILIDSEPQPTDSRPEGTSTIVCVIRKMPWLQRQFNGVKKFLHLQ